MIYESKECLIPNKMFIALYVIGLIGLIGFSFANQALSASVITLAVVFSLLGGLAMLKNISIIRCPTKVLIGAIAFITTTAVIDKYFI